MKSQSRTRRCVFNLRSSSATAVDGVAADRVPCLRKMNSNLMSAACFELAADKRVRLAKRLDIAYVGDRQLAIRFRICAASPTVTLVSNQPRPQFADARLPADDRKIRPLDGMPGKLFNETLFCIRRSRKNQQTTGIPVDTVDRSQIPASLFRRQSRQITVMPVVLRDYSQKHFVETRLAASPLRGTSGFLDVPKRHHSGGLFDDDDCLVYVTYRDVTIIGRRWERISDKRYQITRL